MRSLKLIDQVLPPPDIATTFSASAVPLRSINPVAEPEPLNPPVDGFKFCHVVRFAGTSPPPLAGAAFTHKEPLYVRTSVAIGDVRDTSVRAARVPPPPDSVVFCHLLEVEL